MTFRFLDRPSPMARMDAISKFLWLIVVTVGGFVFGDWPHIAVLLLVVVAVGLPLGRVPLGTFWRGSFVLWLLMAGIFIFQVLFQQVFRMSGTVRDEFSA